MSTKLCKVCNHPDAEAINRGLLEGSLSHTAIAERVGCVRRSVYSHLKQHIVQVLASSGSAPKQEQLVSALQSVELKTERILEECMKKKNFETALKAIARREAQIRLAGEITGALQEKAPNQDAQRRRADQFERAVETLIQGANEQGIKITPKQAIIQLRDLEPSIMEILPLTKFKDILNGKLVKGDIIQ